MAGLQDPQALLDLLYAARADLLSGKTQSYSMGDRSFTLLNLSDLEKVIAKYENIVAARQPIFADLGGINHLPFFPEG